MISEYVLIKKNKLAIAHSITDKNVFATEKKKKTRRATLKKFVHILV